MFWYSPRVYFKRTTVSLDFQYYDGGRVLDTVQSRPVSGMKRTCGAHILEKVQLRFFDLCTTNKLTIVDNEVVWVTRSAKQLIKSSQKQILQTEMYDLKRTTTLEIISKEKKGTDA